MGGGGWGGGRGSVCIRIWFVDKIKIIRDFVIKIFISYFMANILIIFSQLGKYVMASYWPNLTCTLQHFLNVLFFRCVPFALKRRWWFRIGIPIVVYTFDFCFLSYQKSHKHINRGMIWCLYLISKPTCKIML